MGTPRICHIKSYKSIYLHPSISTCPTHQPSFEARSLGPIRWELGVALTNLRGGLARPSRGGSAAAWAKGRRCREWMGDGLPGQFLAGAWLSTGGNWSPTILVEQPLVVSSTCFSQWYEEMVGWRLRRFFKWQPITTNQVQGSFTSGWSKAGNGSRVGYNVDQRVG